MTVGPIPRLLAALGLALVPLIAGAQPADTIPRIGFIGTAPGTTPFEVFRDELRRLGWIEGQTIRIEYRWAQGQSDQAALRAAELVPLKPALITVTAGQYIDPVWQVDGTIPIVFCVHGDPIGAGHVASLARPGGKVTGLSNLLLELGAKSLELLTQAVPGARRIAVLWNPTSPGHSQIRSAVELMERSLGVELRLVPVSTADEFDAAFAAMTRERVDAVLGMTSTVYLLHRVRLAELAREHRLPSVFAWREHAEAGSLLSYGPVLSDMYRRCAAYVDKILKGANPADLPVEQTSTYELVINLKTARALGLTIPPEILARADEVIE